MREWKCLNLNLQAPLAELRDRPMAHSPTGRRPIALVHAIDRSAGKARNELVLRNIARVSEKTPLTFMA